MSPVAVFLGRVHRFVIEVNMARLLAASALIAALSLGMTPLAAVAAPTSGATAAPVPTETAAETPAVPGPASPEPGSQESADPESANPDSPTPVLPAPATPESPAPQPATPESPAPDTSVPASPRRMAAATTDPVGSPYSITANLNYVARTDVVLREQPIESATVVASVAATGVVLTTAEAFRDETSTTWWKVTQGGVQGWVQNASLISLTKHENYGTIISGLTYYAKLSTPLLSVPSSGATTLTTLAKNNTMVTTKDKFGAYWKVRVGTQTGWVKSSDVQNKPIATAAYGTIVAGLGYATLKPINLRQAASDSATNLRSLPYGEVVTTTAVKYLDTAGMTWWRVTTSGKTGYVKSSDIRSITKHPLMKSVVSGAPYYSNCPTTMYQFPSARSKARKSLACSTYAKTTGKGFNGFWEMTSGGTTGWVRSAHLTRVRQPALMVYGTLRSGEAAGHVFAGRTSARAIDRSAQLELWMTPNHPTYGWWPWALNGSTGLTGEKLYFPSSTFSREISRADAWEGYTPGGDPAKMNYLRQVKCASNGEHVYVYVATPWRERQAKSFGTKVPSGDYKRF